MGEQMAPSPHADFPILLICAQMATGGAQRVLLTQADWLHRGGYPVTAAFLYDKEGLLPTWCAEHQFPIVDLGFAPPTANLLLQAALFLRGTMRLLRLMRRGHYAAVETFALHANLVGLPLAWLARIPNRIGSHRGKIEAVGPVLERMNAAVANSWMTKRMVVVSDRARQDAIAEGVRPERTVKIANGVRTPEVKAESVARLRKELQIAPGDLILLSVGRLRHQKGHAVLLQAMPEVLRRFPNAMLLIAGDGVLRGELERQVGALRLGDRAQFLGTRKDVAALLALADVFVFPSRFEGMPNAVLEAMSQGLPVIATAVQGVDELIRDEANGLLVPMDDPAALAEAIVRLMSDADARRRLGEAARATIESGFTVERMCQQFEELLTDRSRRTGEPGATGHGPASNHSHYSYALYADPAVAQEFDQTRFGGQIGQLVATAQERVLDDFLSDLHGTTALDVGCGTGRAALAVGRLGAAVTAVDRSAEMLRIARLHAEAAGIPVEFLPGDANALDFPDESFDLVISLRVLMHTPDWRRCLGEMCRVARRRVIFDYPPLASAPALQVLLRRAMRMAGRPVETYHVIPTAEARAVLEEHGFQIARLHRQFVLPIALHKLVGSERFTEQSEAALESLGLLRLLGAPVTIMAERCGKGGEG